jgi:hypothetical protein
MKCKNHDLKIAATATIRPIVWLGLFTLASACRTERVSQRGPITVRRGDGVPRDPAPTGDASPALAAAGDDAAKGSAANIDASTVVVTATGPFARIAIAGASVSAGFGGAPFGDAFTAAAPTSAVESSANVMLFKDPIGDTDRQLAEATAFKPSIVIALDLLFWDVYGSEDAAWHERALANALAGLEKLRSDGAWIIVGDVPLITNASDWMLPREAIPTQARLDEANRRIEKWAAKGKGHIVLVPLAQWTAPLRTGAKVTLPTGESVEASELMAVDGLHANPLGTWYVLDKLDHYLEHAIPGVAKGALVFKRP